jgi:hypothetical protein
MMGPGGPIYRTTRAYAFDGPPGHGPPPPWGMGPPGGGPGGAFGGPMGRGGGRGFGGVPPPRVRGSCASLCWAVVCFGG